MSKTLKNIPLTAWIGIAIITINLAAFLIGPIFAPYG
jgi:peptide/nickel transport system permease protein